MKVAVSATGKGLDSAVDQRFGRAVYLLIVDTDTEAVLQVIDNQAAKGAEHGAGISAATLIAQAGARAILTGYVGPKAAAVCEQAGIIMVNGAAGSVGEAVQRFVHSRQAGDGEARPAERRGSAAARVAGGRGMMGQGGGRRQGQCARQRR